MLGCALFAQSAHGGKKMRGIFLWLLGLPIPVIILLYIFHVI
jgi:hypothetical protein